MNIYEQCLDEDMERWMGEWMDGQTDNGWKERRIGGWILTRFNGSHGLGHTLDYFLLSILSSFHLLDPRSDPEANFLSLFKITLFLLRHFHNPRGKLISKKKIKNGAKSIIHCKWTPLSILDLKITYMEKNDWQNYLLKLQLNL